MKQKDFIGTWRIVKMSEWDEDYLFTGVYDLQEKYLRKYLEKYGLDYDKG